MVGTADMQFCFEDIGILFGDIWDSFVPAVGGSVVIIVRGGCWPLLGDSDLNFQQPFLISGQDFAAAV